MAATNCVNFFFFSGFFRCRPQENKEDPEWTANNFPILYTNLVES